MCIIRKAGNSAVATPGVALNLNVSEIRDLLSLPLTSTLIVTHMQPGIGNQKSENQSASISLTLTLIQSAILSLFFLNYSTSR